MKKQQDTVYRYSMAFKQKVVNEIEKGMLNKDEARRLYNIGGGATIQTWIEKLGKNHLLCKVVRIEMKNEMDKLKEMEKRNRMLEKALADEKLKNMCLEALVDIAHEKYGIDLKKKSGSKELSELEN